MTLNWRGAWTNSNTYQVGDVCNYQGSAYVANDINTYVVPPGNPSAWGLLMQAGTQGQQGVQGLTGAAGQGLTWRNTYSSEVTYNAYDVVLFGTSTYICIADDVVGVEPDTSTADWNVLATGAVGPQGVQGPTGETGAAGANGIASLPQLAAIRATQPITNLFDPSVAQVGYYFNSDGSLSGGGAFPGFVTAKMAANSGGFMTCNTPLVFGAGGEVIFYDQGGAYLSAYPNTTGAAIPANTPIAVPVGAAFAAWTVSTQSNGSTATCQIVNGSTMPAYIPFAPANTVTIAAEIASVATTAASYSARINQNYTSIRALPDFNTAKNLIGPQIMTNGAYLVGNGTIATGQNPSYQYTAKIPVIGGEPYIIGFPNIPAIPVQPTAVIGGYGGAIYIVYDKDDNQLVVANVAGAVNPGPGVDVLPASGLPNGYVITMPASAAYIRFSGNNLTYTVGCQFCVSDFWTPDVNTTNNQWCSVIFMHGTALPTHVLPYGKSASDYVPYLLDRKIGIWGDSIASNFGVGWEQLLWERGLTKQVQDARPGRNFTQAFEGFQTVTPGTAPSTYDAGVAVGAQSGCAQGGYLQSGQTSGGVNWGGEALGQTLAQVLAPVELLVLALGTNDQAFPLGAFGDATNAGTQYGNMRWVGETLHEANPNMVVLWVTCMPRYDGAGFTATSTLPLSLATAAATVDIASNYFHDPVIDMTKVSGVNAFTAAARTQDGIHPALGAAGMTGYYGGTIVGTVARLL